MEEEELDLAEKKVPEIELTKPEVGAFSEDGRNLAREITSRVCEDCGKVFNSGKAYGGHKRIHTQSIKETSATLPALIKKEGSDSEIRFSGGGDQDIRCSECGRGFPTWKSLFGHMRSHPERSWRGVRRPAETHLIRASNCSSSSTLSWEEEQKQYLTGGNNLSATAGSAVNLMESLKGSWSATAKRGRCAQTDNSIITPTEDMNEEDNMKQAVSDLLMFAQIPQPNLQEDAETTKKIRRKKRRLDELDEEAREAGTAGNRLKDREFTCDICNKQFPSHQALGGHKASHNNKLKKTEAGMGILPCGAFGWLDGGEVEQHGCNICGLTFPTGQALGGHKRRHWMGSPAEAGGSSSQGTGEGSSRAVPVLKFDLNKPPPIEDQMNAQSSSVSNYFTD